MQIFSNERAPLAYSGNLGCVYTELGDLDLAIEYHQKALSIDGELNDPDGQAQGWWDLGETYQRKGDRAKAIEFMQKCVDYESRNGTPRDDEHVRRLDELKAEE